MSNSALLWRQAIKEAYTVAPPDAVILNTIELIHPAMDPTVRLVQDLQPHTLRLETGESFLFEAAAFRFSLPPTGDNGLQELNLQLDNVDRRISDYMEAIMLNPVPITVKYRAYLSNDLLNPQMDSPLTLFLTDLTLDMTQLSGRASFADIINRPFLSPTYNSRVFPGLA